MSRVFRRSYTDPASGRTKKTRKYYGTYTDADGIRRRVPLCTDKAASEAMLNELRTRAEKERNGLVDPFEAHRKRPLREHLADFIQNLRNKGRKRSHWQAVESRCRAIVDGCGFKRIGDIQASRVQAFLADLRRDGLAQQTVNHYLGAVKQFTHWLVKDRRTNDDRLAHLEGGNVRAAGLKRERRELTTDEIEWLLEAALSGPVRSRLTGEQRFMLYATALGTGLRASELASLTPRHFDLTADCPTVRIGAADEKAGRGDVLPIPSDLADLLRPWIVQTPQDARLWPGRWADNKDAGVFLQADLRAARDAWIEEAGDDEAERDGRERSDFLAYRDADGRQADFHALRHTHSSRVGRSGASVKAMQRLMRHTDVNLTMRYTHADLFDLSAAVDRLPPLPVRPNGRRREPQAMKATGTDGKNDDSTGPPTGPFWPKTGPHA